MSPGQLRRECVALRTNRWYRMLSVTPFLIPALTRAGQENTEVLQEIFKLPPILSKSPFASTNINAWPSDTPAANSRTTPLCRRS